MGASLSMKDIEDIKISPIIFKNTLYGMIVFFSSLYVGYKLYK